VRVLLGSDQLESCTLLRGRRVGVVCNPASISAGFRHIVDRVAGMPEVTLAALFGPQHGFRADVQDNMIETPHARDAARQIPVFSLYSDTREPTKAMLDGLDALVIDLQDVGTRVYTYVYTMANCLGAARRYGLPVVVCDRPNPIGGEAVEGPILEPGFESFVGQFPIPLRHGMTVGELARLVNEHFGVGAELEVVSLGGWRRSMYHDDTGLPWVLPSPNLPTLDSAIAYAGTVLLEGTNCSEGRGTTRPFEIIGAPWIVAAHFAARLNAAGLPGAYFRPVDFEPTVQKHAKQACGGCQIHVTDRHSFQPVLTAVAVISEARSAHPGRFAWRDPPYEYEATKRPIDILAGSDALRRQIEAGTPPSEIAASWEPALAEFRELRARFLLYVD
jgi:uncharacterized protein YbbC (DUF1343 family)